MHRRHRNESIEETRSRQNHASIHHAGIVSNVLLKIYIWQLNVSKFYKINWNSYTNVVMLLFLLLLILEILWFNIVTVLPACKMYLKLKLFFKIKIELLYCLPKPSHKVQTVPGLDFSISSLFSSSYKLAFYMVILIF